MTDDPGDSRHSDEWSGISPTEKDMGLVQFVLDEGVKTNVVGTVYGMDYTIEGDGYRASVFFDYYNKRLKINDYSADDYAAMTKRFAWLAQANHFDKIFLKARLADFQQFISHGYLMEGILRYYFRGEDAYVCSRFSSKERLNCDELLDEAATLEGIIYGTEKREAKPLADDIEIIKADENHIPQLVLIYREIFKTYPLPITKPDYLKSLMDANVIFRLAVRGEETIGAASAEMNIKYSNAELSDCASMPAAQGKGLMQHILLALEGDLRQRGIMTAYTIARAKSVGMNRAFFRLGYEFSGRLVKNCDIYGEFEDMNIWVKRL